ncbi:MAG: hypothetical protein ABR987_08495 [Terracidiphilus sp.]
MGTLVRNRRSGIIEITVHSCQQIRGKNYWTSQSGDGEKQPDEKCEAHEQPDILKTGGRLRLYLPAAGNYENLSTAA